METILWYAVFAVSNVIASRFALVLLKAVARIDAPHDGSRYTVCAVSSAVVISFCADFIANCAKMGESGGETA